MEAPSPHELFTLMVEQNDLPLLLLGRDGPLYQNAACRELLGDLAEQGEGALQALVHPEDSERLAHLLDRLRAEQRESEETELRVFDAEGRERRLEFTFRRYQWRGEAAFLAICRDITGTISERSRLLERVETYWTLFNNAQVGIFRTRTSDGATLEANDTGARMFGFRDREHLLDEGYVTTEHYVDPEARGEMLRRLSEQGVVENFEADFRRRDGSIIRARFSARAFPEQGWIEGVIEDITEQARAADELREKTAWLEGLFASVPSGLLTLNREAQITECNTTLAGWLGVPREEVLGRDVAETVHPEDLPEVMENFRCGLAGEEVTPYEVRLLTAEGEHVPVEVHATSILDEAGNVIGRLGILADLRTRKRNEEALRISENRLAIATASANLGVWELDLVENELTWDERMYDLYGVRREEFAGAVEAWESALHPGDRERAVREVEQAVEGQSSFNTSFRIITPEGEERHIRAFAEVVRNAAGEPVRMTGINYDITAETEMQRRLEDSEARLREAQQIACIGHWFFDPEVGVPYWSEQMFRLFGMEPGDPIPSLEEHRRWFEGKTWERFSTAVERAAREGAGYQLELEMRKPDGTTGWVKAICETRPHPSGQGYTLRGTTQDITELKQREQEAVESEQRFRDLLEGLPAGVFIIDFHGRFLFVNESASLQTGYSREELLAMDVEPIGEDNLVPAQREENWHRLRAGERLSFEERHTRKDGSTYDATVNLEAITYQGEPAILSIVHDITALKSANRELEELFERYRALVEEATDAIYLTDVEGRFLDVNPAAEAMTGYCREELLGRSVSDLEAALSGEEILQALAGMAAGEAAHLDGRHRTKDGDHIPVEVGIRCFDTPEGKRFLSLARDISRRVEAEQERLELERRLADAQRAESLGLLAGGVAHDFNNILVSVLGNADIALDELPTDHPVAPVLEEIADAASRAADLARQMLAYSGKGRFVVEPLSLTRTVREILPMVRPSVGSAVQLQLELAEDLPAVEADAIQMRQVVMNLVINAAEAIGEEKGGIVLRTHAREFGQEELQDSLSGEDLPAGRYAAVEVEDDGPGMDPDSIPRIFEPFYSTKFTGRGLGLAAVLGIVHGHGGAIFVRSAPGEGALFRVLLPLAAVERREQDQVREVVQDGLKGLGAVLVVDDEAAVRRVAARIVRRLGLEVLEAASGEEALALYRDRGDAIACVLLDMTMPRMDGKQVFNELHRMDDDVRVVMTSGYNEQEVINQFRELPLTGFVQKPFRIENLRAILARALGDDLPEAEEK